MKNVVLILFTLLCTAPALLCAQSLHDGSATGKTNVFDLAVWTVDNNTDGLLLKAGADYGGEWTRDISINSWNAVSLLRPAVAEYSLWSVTNNRKTIGHQYWDKIIWVIAASGKCVRENARSDVNSVYICASMSGVSPAGWSRRRW